MKFARTVNRLLEQTPAIASCQLIARKIGNCPCCGKASAKLLLWLSKSKDGLQLVKDAKITGWLHEHYCLVISGTRG